MPTIFHEIVSNIVHYSELANVHYIFSHTVSNYMGATSLHQEYDAFTKTFRALLSWKIFYGVMKVLFAIMLLSHWRSELSALMYTLMAHELVEDPNDIFLHVFSPQIQHLAGGTNAFVALYLLFWGVVDDIFLSINILLYKLWAYPVALVLIALFVPYEVYRFMHIHSFILGSVICIDVAIFFILLKEYKKVKGR